MRTSANESGTADAEVSITIQDIAPEISGTSGENITVENGQEITPVVLTGAGESFTYTVTASNSAGSSSKAMT